LEHPEPELARERLDRLEIARLTCQVDGDHDLRQTAVSPRTHQLVGELRHAHVPGARIDVDEIYVGPAVTRAVRACDERRRTRPNEIAGSYAKRQAGDVKRAGAAVHGDRVTRAAHVDDGALEGGHGWTLRQKVRAQNLNDSLDVRVGDLLAS